MSAPDALAAILAALAAAYPEERAKRLRIELESRPGGEPLVPRLSIHCVVCRRNPGAVGAPDSRHQTPFFGRAGGWLEAGGVRFVCRPCLEAAEDRLRNEPLDPGMVRVEALRALRAAGHPETSGPFEELERRLTRASLILRRSGLCTYCERETTGAGSWLAMMCAPCVDAALEELARPVRESSED